MCVFVCVSHMHVSCQQQSGISTLLHVEPQAVHRLELGDLGLLVAHGCSEEPFPQILKRKHSSERRPRSQSQAHERGCSRKQDRRWKVSQQQHQSGWRNTSNRSSNVAITAC